MNAVIKRRAKERAKEFENGASAEKYLRVCRDLYDTFDG
jgi:deoxyadenosine/deoxycytidine kinase